jgi:S-methylmethionine-dependent homocysteine/selenocysteine methylase
VADGSLFDARMRDPRPIVLDGAMGSELYRRGVATRLPLWSSHALISHPEVVAAVHADHARAGAEVLTTNSFRTNIRTLERGGLRERFEELNALAVRLARQAAGSAPQPTWVAGSVAPVEDCYEPERVPPDPELEREHGALTRTLARAGCDLLLVETMNSLREARAALAAGLDTGLPVWVSFAIGPGAVLLSGEDLGEAARDIERRGARAVLVNCAPLPVACEGFRALRAAVSIPCGLYPNHGHSDPVHGWESDPLDPALFENLARGWFEQGARMVGGCCGTTPEHVRAIVSARDKSSLSLRG